MSKDPIIDDDLSGFDQLPNMQLPKRLISFAAGLMFLGVVFKIQQWPFASILLISATVFALVALIVRLAPLFDSK